ncbi:MAG: exosortase/archaeosortase family protein [Phycisphaerae bacterium]
MAIYPSSTKPDRVAPRDRIKSAYLLAAAVLVLLTMLVQHRAWHDIFSIAIDDQDSSHILLVPFLAAWLVFLRRLRWRECHLTGRWLGPVILLLGAATSNFGVDHGMAVFWHFGSLLMAFGAVIAVLGVDIVRKFFPALLMLLFLVPVPATVRQAITVPLEHFSALLSQQVLEIIGVSVSRAGSVLIVNGVKVEIAEACDGMRMAIALMVLVATFAFSTPMNRWARAIFLILSPAVALLCNIIRLVPTVWVFGRYPHATAETFHNIAGWLMLPVAFLLFWTVLRLLRWASVPVAPFGLAYQ